MAEGRLGTQAGVAEGPKRAAVYEKMGDEQPTGPTGEDGTDGGNTSGADKKDSDDVIDAEYEVKE